MPATVRAACAATFIGFALGSPAAAMEEKSTKPRIAVIEFANQAEGKLEVDAVAWGDWIADVERPQAAERFKGEVAGIEPAYRSGGESKARGGTRTVDPKEKITIHGGTSEARLPGRRTPPTVTLKRGQGAAADGDPDRPVIAGTVPTPYNPKEYTVSKDNNWGQVSSPPAGGFTGGVRVATGDVNSDAARHSSGPAETFTEIMNVKSAATGKARYNPYVTTDYLEAPPSAGKGSVRVRVATPWAGCRVGARYPRLKLAGGGKSYVLEDVRVASCGDGGPEESITFVYGRVG